MEQVKLVEQFEKEYYAEASETKVTVDELKHFGVNNKTLSSEVYLISKFGNEIVKHNFVDDFDENVEESINCKSWRNSCKNNQSL